MKWTPNTWCKQDQSQPTAGIVADLDRAAAALDARNEYGWIVAVLESARDEIIRLTNLL